MNIESILLTKNNRKIYINVDDVILYSLNNGCVYLFCVQMDPTWDNYKLPKLCISQKKWV